MALGCDESGRFKPRIGEDNVDSQGRTRRGIKSPTKSYVWDRFLVGWIVAFAVAVCQLSVEVIMSSSMLVSGMAEVCSPECDWACP
jgi:hypothetical protein